MTIKVEKIKQFSVFLPNKPGVLSRLYSLFAQRGIGILGISSEMSDDSGLVRLALPKDADGSGVLSKAGLSSVEASVLLIEVEDHTDQLLRTVEALSAGKINITTVYGTSAPNARTARMILAVENTDKALGVLQALQG